LERLGIGMRDAAADRLRLQEMVAFVASFVVLAPLRG